MKIAIDIDKTLIDCDSLIYNIANFIFPIHINNRPLIYHIVTGSRKKTKLLMKLIFRHFAYNKIQSYHEIQNAISIVNSLHSYGNQIILLSSRPEWCSLSSVIQDWFNYNKMNYDYLVVGCNNKVNFCKTFSIELLIDNSYNICKYAKTQGILSLYFNPYNPHKDNRDALSSWDEILHSIHKMTRSDNKTLRHDSKIKLDNLTKF